MIRSDVDRRVLRASFFALGLAVLSMSGCGPGTGVVPVQGTVKFEGSTLPKGTVRFYPKTGGRPAIGQIQSDGSYKLGTKVAGDGALPGEYLVTIEASETNTVGQAPSSLEEELTMGQAKTTVKYLVPPKYASKDNSGLTRTVEPGNNEINFDLQ